MGFSRQLAGVAVFATDSALLFGVQFLDFARASTPYVIGVTTLLVIVVAWKGERPLRWRWEDTSSTAAQYCY